MSLIKRIGRRLGWHAPSLPPTPATHAKSVSHDEPAYLDVCRRAVSDPAVFASFRRDPGYTRVLEHVTPEHGREYFELLSRARRARQRLAEAAKNDAIGNPVHMTVEPGVVMSPTTLRYLKVADDLERLFGSLDGMSLVEIGIGYGGQCRVLDALFELESYTLIDLRPVLQLADEFLSRFPMRTAVAFKTMNELAPRGYDLAISNYALSELSRELQETYCRKVLAATARGYITFNDIAPEEYQAFSRAELAERLKASIEPEVPLTHPKNAIIVWGARQ